MPYIENSTYSPSFIFKNGHVNTMYRAVFCHPELEYSRKRVELSDGDFIDLDFSTIGSDKLVLLIHGLEGSSNSSYMVSLTSELNRNGYDAVSMNLRGCSGETNRLFSSYHSGKTEDIEEVFNYIQNNYKYNELNMVGYSLGGNLTIKYLGEKERNHINTAVAISTPCDLASTAIKMTAVSNKLYLNVFLKTLKEKALQKYEQFPDSFLSKEYIQKIKNFKELDDLYTAPANGFINAEDYWQKASCKQFISSVKTKTLLINALDDPFFTKESFPIKEAKRHNYFYLETPKYGGHVGFMTYLNTSKLPWCEQRILSFIKDEA